MTHKEEGICTETIDEDGSLEEGTQVEEGSQDSDDDAMKVFQKRDVSTTVTLRSKYLSYHTHPTNLYPP